MNTPTVPQKIHLVGCKRYNFQGELYLAGEVYALDPKKTKYLLDQYNEQTGWSYFEPYSGPEEGKLPSVAVDEPKPPRKERNQFRQRPVRTDRPGRAPTQVTADQARPGRPSAPIENADADADATII